MTSARVPCKKCGAMVLPETAERCLGFCMPCYQKSPDLANALEKRFREWVRESDYRNLLTEDSREHGRLSPEVQAQFEKKYSIELPQDLVQLMQHQNGGWFHQWALQEECLFDGVFPIILNPTEDQRLACMIPVYEWLEVRGDLDDAPDLEEYRMLLERLMILDTDGHFYTCLDFRGGPCSTGIVSVHIEGGFYGDVDELEDSFKGLFNCW